MAKLMLKVLEMVSRLRPLVWEEPAEYVRPRRGDAAADLSWLARDFANVGADLSAVVDRELERHGQR